MTRTFAAWVEPVAAQMRENRRRVIEFARSTPADVWETPSPARGWTCKDILAHLAGGNDQMLQQILRSVAAGRQFDPAIFNVDTDAENARAVEEQRRKPVAELIAYLEADGEKVQDLLSRLEDEHEELRPEGSPISLGQFLQMVQQENHDMLHLEQLRMSLEMPL